MRFTDRAPLGGQTDRKKMRGIEAIEEKKKKKKIVDETSLQQ